MDLRELELEFSVGKNYLDTTGDVYKLMMSLMQADVIFIGFPIFQASIPGALKNVFDLLPDECSSWWTRYVVVTAGSSKHYLIPESLFKTNIELHESTYDANVCIYSKRKIFQINKLSMMMLYFG